MEFGVGILPADVLRLIIKQLNWMTACALTLTCQHWHKLLHEYLLHPTITVQNSFYPGTNAVVIHKGRFLQSNLKNNALFWYESEFTRISDIPIFLAQFEDIICGRVKIPEDPKPKRRQTTESAYPDGVVIITHTNGTSEWLIHKAYGKQDSTRTISAESFELLLQFFEKTIQESLPTINTSHEHCITITQCLGGSKKSILQLDDAGNLRWTVSNDRRTIQTKYPLNVYYTLKNILLSDKKNTLELVEKPKRRTEYYWQEQLLSFVAEYVVDEKKIYNLEKFIHRDKRQKIEEEMTVHREKLLKTFIKELKALFDEETCLYSKYFFTANRHGKLASEGPAPWKDTAFEPKLNVSPLKATRIVPITAVTLSSNHAKRASRARHKWRYLEVNINYIGECSIRRLDMSTMTEKTQTERLDFETNRQFFFELFRFVVKKSPQHSNIVVEPYGLVTNIGVSTRPSRIPLSLDGIRFCWAWVLKNILTKPYPALLKSNVESK